MTDRYVTRGELDDAIEKVTVDIRDTEDRLRDEFTSTIRYELARVDQHLDGQDRTLGRIYWYALTLLAGVITSLILLIVRR